MDVQLLKEALIKFFAGFVIVGLLVFVPAGTLRYPGGLLFMGCLFVPMFVAGLVMLARNPRLLRSRLDAREEQGDQRTVVALSGILFMAVFVVAGLSFRFGWLTVPGSVQHAAAIVFLAEGFHFARGAVEPMGPHAMKAVGAGQIVDYLVQTLHTGLAGDVFPLNGSQQASHTESAATDGDHVLVVLRIAPVEVDALTCQPRDGLGTIPHVVKMNFLDVVEHGIIMPFAINNIKL